MSALPMDTPMCREVYRAIRNRVREIAGGTNAHFDEAVRLELDYQGLQPKPINWVLCASEIEREEQLKMQIEESHEEECAMEREQNRYEWAMEEKYDFSKEN